MGRHPSRIICLETLQTFSSAVVLAKELDCSPSSIWRCITNKTKACNNMTYVKMSDLSSMDIEQYIKDASNLKFVNLHTGTWFECIETGEIFASLQAICRRFGWLEYNCREQIRSEGSYSGYSFKEITDKTIIKDCSKVIT